MLAYPPVQQLAGKTGGDSIAEMEPRFAGLCRARLEDLPMDNTAWRFDYQDV